MQRDGRPPLALIVDDDKLCADTLTLILCQNGLDAKAAYSGEAAVFLARTLRPDVLISDVFMNEMSGAELAARVIEELPACKIILLSGDPVAADHLLRSTEINHGFELLSKPVHPNTLLLRLTQRDPIWDPASRPAGTSS